jgi:hypothetical protein
MRKGTVAGELPAAGATEEDVLHIASGTDGGSANDARGGLESAATSDARGGPESDATSGPSSAAKSDATSSTNGGATGATE